MYKGKTHCKRGHAFDDDNTYYSRQGKRSCRMCGALAAAKRRATVPGLVEYNIAHSKKWRAENLDHSKQKRRDKLELIRALKTECIYCGESEQVCLDFHHRDPSTKRFPITIAAANYSLQVMLDEVAKCDVVCANCHRRLHYGSLKDLQHV